MVRNPLMHVAMLGLAFALLYMVRTSIISKEIAIHTPEKLDRSLARYTVAVLLLYDRNAPAELCRQMQKASTVFRQTSRDAYFRDANLQFLAVEVGNKRFGGQVCDEWQVEQLPAVIICDQGQAITNDQGQVEVLYCLRNRSQLANFIQDTIGDQLQEAIEKKDADRQRRLEEARIQFYESPYYPLQGDYAGDYSWAYPYWGYGYGDPLWGPCGYVGVGFGGCW